eukprot:Skav235305  [mRNA]  locus=scaffold520:244172:247198:- [translate_table: standard]
MLVRLHYGEVTKQIIAVSEEETVGSLTNAEQVLSGLDVRVVEARDRNGLLLDPNMPLLTQRIVVLRYQDPREQIQVTFQYAGTTKSKWWPNGTRAFQMWNKQPNQILVDTKGCQVPWDIPLYHSATFDVIDSSDEEKEDHRLECVSATIPFTVDLNTPPVERQASSCNDLKELVRYTTIQMTQAMMDATNHSTTDCSFYTTQRLNLLCDRGLAMGDDEMSRHLGRFECPPHTVIMGMVVWNEVSTAWTIHPDWIDKWQVDSTKQRLGVLHAFNHWMPMRIRAHSDVVELWNDDQLPPDLETMLMSLLKMTQKAIDVRPMHAMPNCCGFHTLAILAEKGGMEIPKCNAQPDVRHLQQWVDNSKVEKYLHSINACADTDTRGIVITLRTRFVQAVTCWSTMPKFHGNGEGEQTHKQLKMAGQIAAILISRGHRDAEATTTGHELASRDIPQLRNIGAHKEQKAYSMILDACTKHELRLEGASKNQAIMKLQSFFRSKHRQRAQKPDTKLDIKQLQFIPRSFMIMNAHCVDPMPSFSAASRGLSVADMCEVAEFARQGKIITSEACSVLTLHRPPATDQVTTEQLVVPVEDASKNRALVRVWITHFGQKKVIRAPEQNMNIKLEPSHTLAIHMHRELVGNDVWSRLIEGPVKYIMSILKDKNMQTTQVFSRRWTIDGKQCEPKIATAFSVLITVDQSQLEMWLARSGMTSPIVFVQIKKQEDGKDSTGSYRVIWLGKQITDAIASTSALEHNSGLIFKPPNSFGARIHVDHYDEAWKSLKGDEPAPQVINIKYKYMISNLPGNAKSKDIEEWAKQMPWVCRVLRRFNNGSYLIGSQQEVPSWHLSMNGLPVLITSFEDQPKQSTSIVAGRIKMPEITQPEQALNEDPWFGRKLGKGSTPAPVNHHPWALYKPTTQAHENAKDSSTDQRISAIEAEVQSMKEQMANNQSENTRQIHGLDAKISDIQQSMHKSLKEALNEQSTSLIATFEALMKNHPASGKENRERSRSGGKH